MAAGIEIKGLAELAAKFKITETKMVEAAGSAVYGQAVALAELANRKGMVPVRTGNLRASLYITPPRQAGNGMLVELGYGAPYAAAVHERQFSTISQGGHMRAGGATPKWLEKAIGIHARALQVRLQESLTAALAGKVVTSTATGIPTSPPPDGAVGTFQRKRGFTRDQSRAINRLKKSGAVKLVRRWKRRKKGA